MGAHLTLLTVNRVTGFAEGSATGVSVSHHHDAASFLHAAYLVIALALCVALANVVVSNREASRARG